MTPLLRSKGGVSPSTTVAPGARPRGRSATPSRPSRASASPRTPLRLPAGRPTREVTSLVSPLALHRLGKARRQDAALPIPRPHHHRPLVHRGDGQQAGAAGQAGRDGAGPRAVGGIRFFGKESHSARLGACTVRQESVASPSFANPSACKYLRRCRPLNCLLPVLTPSRLPPCRLGGGRAALFIHPRSSRPRASGVLARDVGGVLEVYEG